MVAVIDNARGLHFEIMASALVLVRDGVTGREVVSGLVGVELDTQGDIRFVFIAPLTQPYSRHASHVPGFIVGGKNNVIAVFAVAILDLGVADGGRPIIGGIRISVPNAPRKSEAVPVLKIVYVVGVTRGQNNTRTRSNRRAGARRRTRARLVRRRELGEHILVHPLAAVRVVPGAAAKIRGALVLVRYSPVRPREFVLVHPVNPPRSVAAHGAIAIGIDSPPLGDEHREAAVHGRNGLRALAAQRMTAGIKVERVGDVLLTVGHLVVDGVFGMLVPTGVADQNQVVGILTDCLDHVVGIRLDLVPALVRGLVENLKNHVVVLAPLLRHLAKEGLGVIHTVGRLVGMVVDDDVDVVVDCRLHHGVHKALVVALV